MSTYLDIIPRELTLIVLENLEFIDIYSCINHIDDILAREFLLSHHNDFRLFIIEDMIKDFDNQRVNNSKLNIKELFNNLLLAYIKMDEESEKDREIAGPLSNYKRSENYQKDKISLQYYEENGDYHSRTLIYIKKYVKEEYANLLIQHSMEIFSSCSSLSSVDSLYSDFLTHIFDKDAEYYIYLATEKYRHRFINLRYSGGDVSSGNIPWEKILIIEKFRSYLYRSGKYDLIECDLIECENKNLYSNCEACMARITYPPVVTVSSDNLDVGVAAFLDHNIMLMYLKAKIPPLLILIYYIDSIINTDMGRDDDIEIDLIQRMSEEYQFTSEYTFDLFENHTKLKHLFPNEERVEYKPVSELD